MLGWQPDGVCMTQMFGSRTPSAALRQAVVHLGDATLDAKQVAASEQAAALLLAEESAAVEASTAARTKRQRQKQRRKARAGCREHWRRCTTSG